MCSFSQSADWIMGAAIRLLAIRTLRSLLLESSSPLLIWRQIHIHSLAHSLTRSLHSSAPMTNNKRRSRQIPRLRVARSARRQLDRSARVNRRAKTNKQTNKRGNEMERRNTRQLSAAVLQRNSRLRQDADLNAGDARV